jgi:hypothetical protein
VNELDQVLLAALAALDRAQVPYMLAGAVAASYYGEPRTTHDVDIVVVVTPGSVRRLAAELAQQFAVGDESVRVALSDRTMFNAIHNQSGLKVDFWLLGEDAFDQNAFQRRVRAAALGAELVLPAAEDLIVQKLRWYRESESDRHLTDVRGIVRVQAGKLDAAYIEAWCHRLGLTDLWHRASAF